MSTGTTTRGEEEGQTVRTAVPVVVNASAGPGRRDRSGEVAAALGRAGVPARVRAVEPAAVPGEVARELAAGADMIGVGGGDGTLLSAADVLAGSGVALAVFPAGTLNHFARRLGIPSFENGAEAIAAGKTSTVALGVVDERVFLNTATFGFYADVVRRRERYRGLLGKWAAAVVGFAVTLPRLRMMDVTLVVDGQRLERRTGLVWVGVGRGSFPLVHESPDRRSEPDLEIVVLRPRGLGGSAALILRMLLALRRRTRPVRDPALEILHARQLLIQGRHHIGVTLDGEVFRSEPPVLVAIQAEALRVVTPAGDTTATRASGLETG